MSEFLGLRPEWWQVITSAFVGLGALASVITALYLANRAPRPHLSILWIEIPKGGDHFVKLRVRNAGALKVDIQRLRIEGIFRTPFSGEPINGGTLQAGEERTLSVKRSMVAEFLRGEKRLVRWRPLFPLALFPLAKERIALGLESGECFSRRLSRKDRRALIRELQSLHS